LEDTFENNPEARLNLQAMRLGDNVGDGAVTADDMQRDLFQDAESTF